MQWGNSHIETFLTLGRARTDTSVNIRRIHTDDAPLLGQMYERLSTQSLYFRYLRMYRPSLDELAELCRQDQSTGTAYVARATTPQPTIIGVAHYVIEPAEQPTAAEIAVVVEDGFQGRGVGRRLLSHLYQHARQVGVRSLTAYVHPRNVVMMHLLRSSGLPVTERNLFDVREFRLVLPALHPIHRSWEQASVSWPRTIPGTLFPRGILRLDVG